jgi:hypothetical protein
MNKIGQGVGSIAAGVKISYDNRVTARKEAILKAEEAYRRWRVATAYKYVAVEINETLNAAAKVIGGIAETQPGDLLLAFDRGAFVDDETHFVYTVQKADGDEEIMTLQDTINNICRARFKQRLSPFGTALDCEVEDETGRYLVNVGNTRANQIRNPKRDKGLGYHVGLLYVPGGDYCYISSRKPQHITYDEYFHLMDGGIWTPAVLDCDGYITVSSGERYPAHWLHGKYARIKKKPLE